MRLTSPATARPTSAEQVRSVLATAPSLTVVTDRGRTEAERVDTGPFLDRIRLRPLLPAAGPEPGALPAGEEVAAELEFTDVAPVPVQDRVRARVSLYGRLRPRHTGPGTHSMAFDRALLHTPQGEAVVGRDALLAARTDPLATCEAGMLTHLVSHHADLVTVLMRLVEPRFSQGVVRALPLALDRYGITLRLEYVQHFRDVRLDFPTALSRADQTRERIHSLVAEALRTSPRGRRAARLGRERPQY